MSGDLFETKAKAMMLSRLPRAADAEFKTAKIAFFSLNNPHMQADAFPLQELTYDDIEKVRIIDLNVSYYLEGNDLIINNLKNAKIRREGNVLWVTGVQEKKHF